MSVLIAMLRGVNVGGNHPVNMEALRNLCTKLGMKNVQSYIQSGNLVFRANGTDPKALAGKLEIAIEKTFGFKAGVVARTTPELRKVIANNPFANRSGIEPSRLLVLFLAQPPADEVQKQIMALPSEPEEHIFAGSELYIYYPNGMARPKIPLARIEKILQCISTGRNWNTVNKLLAMAEALEGAAH
jgi:uncharacterized protein (DUF1697 family)